MRPVELRYLKSPASEAPAIKDVSPDLTAKKEDLYVDLI